MLAPKHFHIVVIMEFLFPARIYVYLQEGAFYEKKYFYRDIIYVQFFKYAGRIFIF